MAKLYHVTYVRKDGSYHTMNTMAHSIAEAKRNASKYGEPVRVYYKAELIWEKRS